MSRPIVVIVCMDAPPNRGSFNSAHIRGTHVPGGGAVHSIKTGLEVVDPVRSPHGIGRTVTERGRLPTDGRTSWRGGRLPVPDQQPRLAPLARLQISQ